MYTLIKSVIKDEDGNFHDTYGISNETRQIKDISVDKEKVERLVSLCNSLNLSPMHLDDVVEDFLTDLEI